MPGQAIVTIENKEWSMDVATLSWELSHGLGGLAEIQPATGMFFDLGYEQVINVTTVPMLFTLDIAFLSEDLEITEIYRDIEPGYLVTSQIPARYFIEVNAGELSDIEPGDMAYVRHLSTEQMPMVLDSELVSIITLTSLLVIGGFVTVLTRDFASGAG